MIVMSTTDAIRVELAVILMFPLVVCFPYLLWTVRRLNRSEPKQSLAGCGKTLSRSGA